MDIRVPIEVIIAAKVHQSSIPNVRRIKKRATSLAVTVVTAMAMSKVVTNMRTGPPSGRAGEIVKKLTIG